MMKTNDRCDYIVALIDACLAEIAGTSSPGPAAEIPRSALTIQPTLAVAAA